ncbi:MAG: MFS transporter [Hyphomicrobiaceae bacterium]|nr:MFS transporter [Hyphomicrobiaceae bacterium]
MRTTATAPASPLASTQTAAVPIVLALCFTHFLNDLVQALLPAIYPIIKASYNLDFGQIGLLTLAFQFTASLLQPVVGMLTDRHPQPFSLVAGMGSTLVGLMLLATASSYGVLLLGAALIGTGSAVFHPEATRMARLASGGRHGLTQSLFQVGGQMGQAAGPLLAAAIIVPTGQGSLAWFSAVVLVAMLVLTWVGRWYGAQQRKPASPRSAGQSAVASMGPGVALAISILFLLMFSKNAYTASLTSYYTFYLIDKFQVTVQSSQVLLFLFLVAQATGALAGGYLGDRIGRRAIIWISILGALPFTLMLPWANLFWTAALTILIGFIMSSAFPAILTYALEMMPSKVGMMAGMFYGVSFGLGALSAAALGKVADWTSIETVYRMCAFLPLLGLAAWFLPPVQKG